jgi:deoxyribonucleoside regulator
MFDRKIMAQVAEMFYVYGMSQTEISKRLNFSITKVCRIIKEARKKEIVRFLIEDLCIRHYELEEKIKSNFKLKEAIIYANNHTDKISNNIIFDEVGKIGAQFLERNLSDNMNIAVGSGRSLYFLAKNIYNQNRNNVKIFPSNLPVDYKDPDLQSNNIARIISEKLGGNYYPLNLSIFLYDTKNKNYYLKKMLFDGIIKDMSEIDFHYSSLGSFYGDFESLLLAGLKPDFFNQAKSKHVIGEYGLNLFNKNGEFVKIDFQEKLLYLDINEILKIKNRVLVSFGKYKVVPMRSLLKSGVIDIVVTDSKTAEDILNI